MRYKQGISPLFVLLNPAVVSFVKILVVRISDAALLPSHFVCQAAERCLYNSRTFERVVLATAILTFDLHNVCF